MINRRLIDGDVVYDFTNLEHEDDLEIICSILIKKYPVDILAKHEGPGTTIWDITIRGDNFSLVNNSWGSFIKPLSQTAKEFIDLEFKMI